jgi:anti-sigma regulatory factor (Ser/Thr protein kinase)
MSARTFPAAPESVAEARRFALASLGLLPEELKDTVTLMLSEVATNALVYGRTEFQVSIDVSEDIVRVEVSDGGPGTPTAGATPPSTEPRGRGLLIVAGLARAWGVEPAAFGVGKTVWFTVAVRNEDAQPAGT